MTDLHKKLNISKFKILFLFILLGVIIYFPLFLHLDRFVVRCFDESRLAINALEMHLSGYSLATTFNGVDDLWNTKPPLLILMQCFFMKLVGINELAVRLPSALAGLLTCIVIILFFRGKNGNLLTGIFSSLVLITSEGYIAMHAARTGDYDALLTLFMISYLLMFYQIFRAESSGKRNAYIFFFYLFVFLSIMTKSVQGIMFLPGILLYYVVFEKKTDKKLFLNLVIGFIILIIAIGGYYITRNYITKGYIQAVLENEVGGRYLSTIEGHKGNFFKYINLIIFEEFSYWITFSLFGIFISIFSKDEKIKKIGLLISITLLTYLVAISISKTKCEQYDVPLFPLFAIMAGICLNFIFESVLENVNAVNKIICLILFVFLLFYYPYSRIIKKVYQNEDSNFYDITYFLKSKIQKNENIGNCIFISDNYNGNNLFYIKILNLKGNNIKDMPYTKENEKQSFKINDKIISYKNYISDNIQSKYKVTVLEKYKEVILFRIDDIK
ncbi:MAG: glycosyltransferase family 39 protein [Bacteroidota bacterium]|nr:glycosyltransferase family 39 protein [Bacteroidota bacterium]